MTPEELQQRVADVLVEAGVILALDGGEPPDRQNEDYVSIFAYDAYWSPDGGIMPMGGRIGTTQGSEKWAKTVTDTLNGQDWVKARKMSGSQVWFTYTAERRRPKSGRDVWKHGSIARRPATRRR